MEREKRLLCINDYLWCEKGALANISKVINKCGFYRQHVTIDTEKDKLTSYVDASRRNKKTPYNKSSTTSKERLLSPFGGGSAKQLGRKTEHKKPAHQP